MYTDAKIVAKTPEFYNKKLDLSFESLKTEVESILDQPLNSADDLIKLIEKYSEFNRILGEETAWKYIKMTQFSDKPEYAEDFNSFYENVMSPLQAYDFKVKKRIYETPFREELDTEKYDHMISMIVSDMELFREENLPIKTELQKLASKYGAIYGGITVSYKGEEKTLTQMGVFYKDSDRSVREEAYRLVNEKLIGKKDELNTLFDEMKQLRMQLAKNAGFDNFRDFKHKEMGRTAYTPEDIMEFHNAVEKAVIPFLKELDLHRKEVLKVDKLRPWDTSVDLDGKILKPFATTDEFINKAMEILHIVKPEFGEKFNMMKNTELLDLENRKGKSPGGYNYPLEALGSSFIFMNAVGLHRDIVTLLHEAGHAMHSFAIDEEKNMFYRETPSEVAELASMAMELLTMNNWDKYYSNEDDFKKAKRDQLEGTLSFLPWCMIVDAFQQWIYTNPNHTVAERDAYFTSLMERFNSGVDYSGLEKIREVAWLKQIHIFEVPFYYIEYGMAQLGALAVYKNYRENGDKAIDQYNDFLKAAYKMPVNKVYEAAGIKFDFSEAYIRELIDFVKKELEMI